MTEQKQAPPSKRGELARTELGSESLKERLDARMAAAEKRREAKLHDKQFKAQLTSLRIIGLQKERKLSGKFCSTDGCWQEKPCPSHPVLEPPRAQPKGGFAERETARNLSFGLQYSINVYDDVHEILPRMYLGNFFAAGRRDLMKQYHISHVLTVGNGIDPPEMGLIRKQLPIEDESRENILNHMIEAFAFIDQGRGIDPTTPFPPPKESTVNTKKQTALEDDCPFTFETEDESVTNPTQPANDVNISSLLSTTSSEHKSQSTPASVLPFLPALTPSVLNSSDVSALVSSPPSTPAIYIHCAAGVSRSASMCIAYCMMRERMSYEEAHAHVLKCRPIIRPNYGFTTQLKLLHAKGDIRAAAQEWAPGRGEVEDM